MADIELQFMLIGVNPLFAMPKPTAYRVYLYHRWPYTGKMTRVVWKIPGALISKLF